MKTIIKFSLSLFLCSFLIGCSEDDDLSNSGLNLVTIRFPENFSIPENEGSKQVQILFNKGTPAAGEIQIKLELPEGLSVQTIPEAVDNIITLPVNINDESVSFTITPVDDDFIDGMLEMRLSFFRISEGFFRWPYENMSITIIDDELVGKPYSSSNSVLEGYINGSSVYEYREDGKISKLNHMYDDDGWPGMETFYYYYYDSGEISRINVQNRNTYFYWSDGRIESSEEFLLNTKTSYTLYNYDAAGNIAGKTVYTRQSSGEYAESFKYTFLYFENGNLNKQLTYIPTDGPAEYQLISTRTYDNYLEKINLFPINEIVPGVVAQFNLPGSYTIEENGTVLSYNFNYEFDTAGKVTRRTTNDEVITFSYYQ